MSLRALKGAATVKSNTKEDIWQMTRFLFTDLCSKNQVQKENLCTIIFSSTKDLTAAYPSEGISTLPFFTKNPFPLFDVQHTNIDDGRAMCVRILLFVDIE